MDGGVGVRGMRRAPGAGARGVRRAASVVAVALGALLALPAAPAAAHPLGNFTTNTADALVVGETAVDVRHVRDLAEIPTITEQTDVDTDRDGVMSDAELRGYAGPRCRQAAGRLSLSVDGRAVPLRVRSAAAEAPPGEAGLPTLRTSCELRGGLSGPVAEGAVLLFSDRTSGDRFGWREVTAQGDRVTLRESDVPTTSVSEGLRTYPTDVERPEVSTARLVLAPGGPALVPDGAVAEVRGLGLGPVDRLFGRVELGPGLALLSVLVATVLGAGHALAPGHGKAVMAAFVVARGQDRRRATREAVGVGLTVAATHTVGVLLLGLGLAGAATVGPDRLFGALTAASGLALVVIGALLARDAQRRRATGTAAHVGVDGAVLDHEHEHSHPHDGHGHPHPHPHPHDDHGHPHPHDDHEHPHPHPRGHEHDPVPAARAGGGAAPTATAVVHRHGLGAPHSHELPSGRGWGRVVALGVAGGTVPSPSALVVLLAAAGLGRPVVGVLLVVAYGLGMAATLTAVGVLLARSSGSRRLQRLLHGRPLLGRVAELAPLLTAGVVVLVGLGLLARGLLSL